MPVHTTVAQGVCRVTLSFFGSGIPRCLYMTVVYVSHEVRRQAWLVCVSYAGYGCSSCWQDLSTQPRQWCYTSVGRCDTQSAARTTAPASKSMLTDTYTPNKCPMVGQPSGNSSISRQLVWPGMLQAAHRYSCTGATRTHNACLNDSLLETNTPPPKLPFSTGSV